MENPMYSESDGDGKLGRFILADSAATSTMSNFEILDKKPPGKCRAHFIHIFTCVYLLLLTCGFVYLASRDLAHRHELSAFREEICNMKCLHETIHSDMIIEDKMEIPPDLDLEGNITIANASALSSGPQRATQSMRALEEEIRIIKVQNILLNMRIRNITKIAGKPGMNGERGAPGPPGVKGEKGDAGPPGAGDGSSVGPPGPPGKDGVKGEPGDQGPVGLKGDTGAPGDPGPSGVQGPAGQKGDKGDTGTNGMPGAPGEPGNSAQKGDKGEPGEKGSLGVKGSSGVPGVNGMPGQPGLKGNLGAPGIPGPQGPEGQKGSKGDSGNNGPPGFPGAAGRSGEKGQKGDTGTNGNAGQKGDQGPAGPKGLQGSKGDKGVAGPPGPKGQPGEKGSPGPAGPPGAPGRNQDIVRIVGGRRGRVEILRSGEWGTICDDEWDSKDGAVICKMLGYTQVVTTFTASPGTGKIWLDDVKCVGNESSILLCPKSDWEKHNCGHNEDAGVECS